MGGWDRGDERAVDVVQGCFFLIRRADWEALGGLDATFVMYGEEADLCRRARARRPAADDAGGHDRAFPAPRRGAPTARS